MENKFRNEMLIKLAGEEILLRPTFENLAAMESKMGSIAYLAFKSGAKADLSKVNSPAEMIKCTPPATETAQIIYFNQAEHKFNLEQILEMVLDEGAVHAGMNIMPFLLKMTAGNKMQKQPSESEKKS